MEHVRVQRVAACGFAAIALFGLPAIAAAAPPKELLGKSVVVTWSEQRVQRFVGEANFRNVNASHTLSIYVSGAGRVFSKFQASTRLGTGANEQVAGQGGNRIPSFSGNRMTMIQPGQGMARMISVEFDSGFGSCNASAVRGKEAGVASGYGTSVINGKRLEIQSVNTSGASCSVKSGNVFEGQ